MRIKQKGVDRGGERFAFSFAGEMIEAFPGESLAAALLAAGRLTCRETRQGEARGLFCGMGVCGECSVIVDGRPRRACMEMAAPGMIVEPQPALRDLGAAAPQECPKLGAWKTREVDVLVIGAGPAGLAAARAAARSGAEVLLVDERAKAGGQYFKQPGAGFVIDETRIDPQFREGIELYRSTVASGVEFRFGVTVWGAFAGPQLAVASGTGKELLSARRVVVTPGAYERPLPFPGWTLPGVMTTGAAQTLLRAYQTAPGQRVLVAGNGPLNLQVARELHDAGARVMAVAELSSAPSLAAGADVLRMGLASPGLVMAGMGHLLRLARARVPIFHRHVVVGASGSDRVESVRIARVDDAGVPLPDSETCFEVDAVCLGYGFLAQSEIARALGVEHAPGAKDSSGHGAEDSGNQLLACDETGRSISAAQVFIAGDARGLGGARVAAAQGALAGAEAALDLGFPPDAERSRALRADRRALLRHRRFQKALWSLYRPPGAFAAPATLALADRGTVICRCESVTLGQLEDLRATGVASIGALKRETRAGMGRCQGRYCAALLARLGGEAGLSSPPADALQSFFAPRPPFKPLSLAELASAYDPGQEFDRSAGVERTADTVITVATDPAPAESLP